MAYLGYARRVLRTMKSKKNTKDENNANRMMREHAWTRASVPKYARTYLNARTCPNTREYARTHSKYAETRRNTPKYPEVRRASRGASGGASGGRREANRGPWGRFRGGNRGRLSLTRL